MEHTVGEELFCLHGFDDGISMRRGDDPCAGMKRFARVSTDCKTFRSKFAPHMAIWERRTTESNDLFEQEIRFASK